MPCVSETAYRGRHGEFVGGAAACSGVAFCFIGDIQSHESVSMCQELCAA